MTIIEKLELYKRKIQFENQDYQFIDDTISLIKNQDDQILNLQEEIHEIRCGRRGKY